MNRKRVERIWRREYNLGSDLLDARVGFHRLDGPIHDQERWHGRTDDRGRFEKRLPAGRYRAEVREKDSVLASAVIAVTEGGKQSLELRLADR